MMQKVYTKIESIVGNVVTVRASDVRLGDLALVAGLGMDAAGAAIATVLAQAVSVVPAVVLLKKHLNELNTFRHTAFLPSDFMEGVDFSKFTLQLFPEKKKK